jgi:predicted oxidoreductase
VLLPKLILGTMRLGSWGANYSVDALGHFLQEVHETGIDTLDTGDIYGDHSTNALIGRALAQSGLRGRFNLIGKAGILLPQSPGNSLAQQHYNNSAEYLEKALDQMLRDLQTEQLHQFLLHRIDVLQDVQATVRFAERAIAQGKIRRFGLSNAALTQVSAFKSLDVCANQLSLSLGDLSSLDQLISYQTLGVTVQAYSPLKSVDSPGFADTIKQMSQALNLSEAQLHIAWLARLVNVQIIIGTTQIDRVRALLAASQAQLSHAQWYALLTAARGHAMA